MNSESKHLIYNINEESTLNQFNTKFSSSINEKKNSIIIDRTSNLDDLVLVESETKNKILCDTFKLVDGEETKNFFQSEVFERVAAIINSKFYNILKKSLENISKTSISKKIKIKLLKIVTCFYPSNNRIDYIELRKLMFEGLPEELPDLRSILWKLFLNFYPNNLNEWELFSREKNEDYERIKADLLNGENEKYKSLIYEITSDITRTRTDLNFFNANINFGNSGNNFEIIFGDNSYKKQTEIYDQAFEEKENEIENINNLYKNENKNLTKLENKGKNIGNVGDLLIRILLIFAILHPDLAYIQGMNEILATIYFCFAKSNEVYLESDLFYCFENFMLEVKDIYLKENDNSNRGIHGIVKIIENLLDYYDPDLSNHFKDIGIEINFFVLRWILIFFSQEFFMPETLRLWDSLLIESDKFKFITFVSLSIIIKKREELLRSGFAEAMFSLQNLKNLDFSIDEILKHVKLLDNKLNKIYQLLL